MHNAADITCFLFVSVLIVQGDDGFTPMMTCRLAKARLFCLHLSNNILLYTPSFRQVCLHLYAFSRLHNAQCPLPIRLATRAPSKSNPFVCNAKQPHAQIELRMRLYRLWCQAIDCFRRQLLVVSLKRRNKCALVLSFDDKIKAPRVCACF